MPILIVTSAKTINNMGKAGKLKHILFVDDDRQTLLLAKLFLEREGFKVHSSPETQTARKVLQKHPIDLIITDVGLPGENGLEFYDWLQEQEAYRNIPVLFVSAHAVGFDEHLTRHRDRFIVKPIFFPDLIKRLKQMFEEMEGEGQ